MRKIISSLNILTHQYILHRDSDLISPANHLKPHFQGKSLHPLISIRTTDDNLLIICDINREVKQNNLRK